MEYIHATVIVPCTCRVIKYASLPCACMLRIPNSSYCSGSFDCVVCFACAIHRTIALIRLSQNNLGTGGGDFGLGTMWINPVA